MIAAEAAPAPPVARRAARRVRAHHLPQPALRRAGHRAPATAASGRPRSRPSSRTSTLDQAAQLAGGRPDRAAPPAAGLRRAPRRGGGAGAHRPQRGDAPGRGARDGRGPAGRGRLLLLRRPRGGRAAPERVRLRTGPLPAWTSAARPGAWSGCWPRRARRSPGTAAIPIAGRDRVGAEPTSPGVSFARSPEHPPLPYADAPFDSRSRSRSGATSPRTPRWPGWPRCGGSCKPGGRLLITTHGEQTVAHDHARREPSLGRASSREMRDALFDARLLVRRAEFGEAGDHGVANPDWGTAFLTAEWLLARPTPEWHVALFRPGRVEGNQDLYVLEPPVAERPVSVVIPVEDGGPLLGRVLEGCAPRASSSCVVIDSGSTRRLAGDRARARRPTRAGDPAGRVRARAHAQPGRRAHVGRADLLPHPGRGARSPAGSPPTARPSSSTRAWAPSFGPHLPQPGHQPDDRSRADRSSSPASPRTARPRAAARGRPHRSSRT